MRNIVSSFLKKECQNVESLERAAEKNIIMIAFFIVELQNKTFINLIG